MSVKLTDKEISALAKKVGMVAQKANTAAKAELVKKKVPEAKKILAVLNALPEQVLHYLYHNRYQKGSVTAHSIAGTLVEKTEEDGYDNRKVQEMLEADVILAAHECPSMAALCKKLGI